MKFVFTGTKETVSLAELLVNYQLKHNKELDELREEIERKLPPRQSPLRRRNPSTRSPFGSMGGGSAGNGRPMNDFPKRGAAIEPDRDVGGNGGRGRRGPRGGNFRRGRNNFQRRFSDSEKKETDKQSSLRRRSPSSPDSEKNI